MDRPARRNYHPPRALSPVPLGRKRATTAASQPRPQEPRPRQHPGKVVQRRSLALSADRFFYCGKSGVERLDNGEKGVNHLYSYRSVRARQTGLPLIVGEVLSLLFDDLFCLLQVHLEPLI